MSRENIEKISNGLYVLLIGFVLLWISLGFVKWNIILQLLRLWPLFFVVVGIDIIFDKTRLFFLKILSTIIVIISVFSIIYVAQSGNLFQPRKMELLKIGKDASETKVSDFDINFSSGILKVSEAENYLISANLTMPLGFNPQINFGDFEKEDLYKFTVNSRSEFIFAPWDEDHLWNIKIGEKTSSTINAKTYFSNSKLNISRTSISELNLNTKFGFNEIIFGQETKKAMIESLGSTLTVLIPKEMGVKIYLNKFLIKDNFNALGMDRGFKEYRSSNYDQAPKKLDLELNLKFSQVEIRFY